jgi:uncharacterized protein (TIGR02271 family)
VPVGARSGVRQPEYGAGEDDLRTSRETTRGGSAQEDRAQALQPREEELPARTEPVEAGEARIGKEVVEREETVDVPRMREEVEVERRLVDRRPADRPVGEGAGEAVEAPVREERVSVEKEPVVYEEVDVRKRPD